jgi:hypothetical protein
VSFNCDIYLRVEEDNFQHFVFRGKKLMLNVVCRSKTRGLGLKGKVNSAGQGDVSGHAKRCV